MQVVDIRVFVVGRVFRDQGSCDDIHMPSR